MVQSNSLGIATQGVQYFNGTALYSGVTGSTGQVLQANTSSTPTYSTATYPSTTTVSQILYSSATNVVSGLATTNNGVLITSSSGVPSLLTAGTTGQVLSATTGSPPSWTNLSSLGVTSITGTVNQIIASSPTGAVTLSTPQDIATTSAVTFASGTFNKTGTGPQTAATFNNTDVSGVTSEARVVFAQGNNYYQGISGAFNNGNPFLGISASSTINTWNGVASFWNTGGLSVGTGNYTIPAPTNGLLVQGNTAIGGAAATSAVLTLISTTQGFLPPSMTTTQKNAISSPTAGLSVYDNVLNDIQFWNGSSWIGTSLSGVTSITGTANQVIASSPTGAVTLSLPQSIATTSAVQFGRVGIGVVAVNNQLSITGKASIGFADIAAPTNGLCVAGQVNFGDITSPSNCVFGLTAGVASQNSIIRMVGTLAFASNPTFGIRIEPTFTTEGGNTHWGIYAHITYNTPALNTVTSTTDITSSPVFTGAGTITNAYGFRSIAFSRTGTAITNAYGAFFADPAAGATTNAALCSANGVIGYTAVTPPTNGLLVNGQVSIGTSTPPASVGLYVVPALTIASPVASLYGASISPTLTFNSGSTGSFATGLFVQGSSVINSGASLTSQVGIFVNPLARSGAGTGPTNAAGLVAFTPSIGTNSNIGIYTDTMSIGYQNISTPSNSLSIAGFLGVGDSLASGQIGIVNVGAAGTGPQILAYFNNSDSAGATSESRIVFGEGGNWFQGITGKYNNNNQFLGIGASNVANTWNGVASHWQNGGMSVGTVYYTTAPPDNGILVSGDFSLSRSANSQVTAAIRNTNNGGSAVTQFAIGSDTSASEFTITTSSSGAGGNTVIKTLANDLILGSNNVSQMYFDGTSIGVFTASPDLSAVMDFRSTTQGVRFPNMTTTQKNAIASPGAGLVVFDTDLSKLCVYSGIAWQTITSI